MFLCHPVPSTSSNFYVKYGEDSFLLIPTISPLPFFIKRSFYFIVIVINNIIKNITIVWLLGKGLVCWRQARLEIKSWGVWFSRPGAEANVRTWGALCTPRVLPDRRGRGA